MNNKSKSPIDKQMTISSSSFLFSRPKKKKWNLFEIVFFFVLSSLVIISSMCLRVLYYRCVVRATEQCAYCAYIFFSLVICYLQFCCKINLKSFFLLCVCVSSVADGRRHASISKIAWHMDICALLCMCRFKQK